MANTMMRELVDALRPNRGEASRTPTPLPSDTPEVAQLLVEPWFDDRLAELVERLGRDLTSVKAEAAGNLREMSATQGARAGAAWHRFGSWITRAYDLYVDDDRIQMLRQLDRRHSLVFLPSHRSYLDAWVTPQTLYPRGISPLYGFGGANLNFFPFGTLAKRTGMIFIRRKMTDAPIYRFALRSYIGQLIRNGENLGWSIEGGRTRTGKMRPPVYGILNYLIDAVDTVDGDEVYLVPMSIVYDQLHEVATMTTEARGGRKNPEDIRWLVRFARQQKQRLGRGYVDIGEPVPLRQRLAEMRADESVEANAVERIALDVCHRINRATPVTPTAVANLSLLGADRALTLDEVLATVGPLATYIGRRHWPVAGAADLTDRSTIRRALQELVASGVLTCYDGGSESVWSIAPDKHLVAAFYRNTVIHVLVDRAIAEVAVLAAADAGSDAGRVVTDEALRLRDLLKFEFFFSARQTFAAELTAELQSMAPDADLDGEWSGADAMRWLTQTDLHLAHLVLRPFLDAYAVVADQLADYADGDVDEERFLSECLRTGRQRELQRRLASAESVSLELFKTALRLAKHRGLIGVANADDSSDGVGLAKRRQEFAEEVASTIERITTIAEMARVKSASR